MTDPTTRPDAPAPAPTIDAASLRQLRIVLDVQRAMYGNRLREMRAALVAAGDEAKRPELAADLRAVLRDLHDLAGPYA